ncbi:MAG TPA: serine hydrolase, partial [Thermomicrobiales bacterium]|nr:serine hydrolase [Thermomicrobiales bacterium]
SGTRRRTDCPATTRARRRPGGGAAWLRALAPVVLLILALPFVAAFSEPGLLPGVTPGEGVVTAGDLARLRSQPAPPAITARNAIVWDVSNGAELYSKAPDDRVAPASTTKMLTALLVIEYGHPDQRVTIEQGDMVPQDESAMGLAPGDTLTLDDLLYGMLLVSGGDAARAAARVVGAAMLDGAPGDPVARFMQAMNDRVAQLGLKNTHFVNPDGYDADGHYSSARDLLVIANAALQNPTFAQIVGTKVATRHTVDGGKAFPMTNTNELLGQRPGIHGVKTGTTDAAGECLVAAQWTAYGRIIAVVLGSADDQARYTDTTALLDYANAAYRWITVGQGADQPPGLAPALARWGVAFRDRRTVVVQTWEAPTLSYHLLLGPSAAAGADARGKVVFTVGAREVLTLPVYPAR